MRELVRAQRLVYTAAVASDIVRSDMQSYSHTESQHSASAMSTRESISQSDVYSSLFLPSLPDLPIRPAPETVRSSDLGRSTIASLYRLRTGVTLKPWQLDAVHARLQGRHVVVVQPCGSGKTVIFVAPIVILNEYAKANGIAGGTGWVSVVVCPRDSIEEQVVCLSLLIYEIESDSTQGAACLALRYTDHSSQLQPPHCSETRRSRYLGGARFRAICSRCGLAGASSQKSP